MSAARRGRAAGVSRLLATLAVVTLFHSASNSVGTPILPLFVVQLKGSALAVGLVIASSELLPMLLALHVGVLIARVGPRFLMQVGSVLFVGAAIARALAPGIPTLVLAQVAVGFSTLLIFLSAQSYVALISPPADRARNFGHWSFMTAGGQIIGPTLGGVATDILLRAGIEVVAAYRIVLLSTAVFATISGIAAWVLRPTPLAEAPSPSLRQTLPDAARLLRNPSVVVVIWASFAIFFNDGLRRSFFPLYLSAFSMSPTAIGLLVSSYSVASMTMRAATGLLSQRWGELRTLIRCLLLIAVAWSLFPWVRSPAMLLLATALAGTGAGVGGPITMALAVRGVSQHQVGLGLGIRQMTSRIAEFLSPALFGVIASVAGLTAPFFLAAGCAVGCAAVLARSARSGRQAVQSLDRDGGSTS